MSVHTNNGSCDGCQKFFDTYPGFNADLRAWFVSLQRDIPTAHISCAGRGQEVQEKLFKAGLSKARWGESAHNYNCAIDIFQNIIDQEYSIDFYNKITQQLPDWIQWGFNWERFREKPHFEIKNWLQLADQGTYKKVE